MLTVEVVLANGKRYKIAAASQVVVYAETGDPVAITYEHSNLILHTDAQQSDFDSVCGQLRVKRLDNG